MVRMTVVLLLALSVVITGCGGGNNNSTGNTSSSSNPTSTVGRAQGVYSGTTSTGSTFESIILPNDKYYALYGTTSGNVFYVYGIITGQGASGSSTYTANVTDYYYTGAKYTGSLTATYNPGSSVNGTVSESGNANVTFSGTALPASSFNYNTAALLSSVTGTWTGTIQDGTAATVIINSNGTFTGSDSGCSFSGTMTPDSSNKNFFNVTMSFGGYPCLHPNQTASGIAIDYLLSNGTTRQLLAGVTSADYGTIFSAVR